MRNSRKWEWVQECSGQFSIKHTLHHKHLNASSIPTTNNINTKIHTHEWLIMCFRVNNFPVIINERVRVCVFERARESVLARWSHGQPSLSGPLLWLTAGEMQTDCRILNTSIMFGYKARNPAQQFVLAGNQRLGWCITVLVLQQCPLCPAPTRFSARSCGGEENTPRWPLTAGDDPVQCQCEVQSMKLSSQRCKTFISLIPKSAMEYRSHLLNYY